MKPTFVPDFDNVGILQERMNDYAREISKKQNELIERQLKLSLIAKGHNFTDDELMQAALDRRLVRSSKITGDALEVIYELDGTPIMRHDIFNKIDDSEAKSYNVFTVL